MTFSKAVERAKYQLVLAMISAGLSVNAALQSAYGAAASSGTPMQKPSCRWFLMFFKELL